MGLFINSHLQALNMHKRLTELEKLSEISTGIIALKNMVEQGESLQDRRQAIDNLSRILPMLSTTQQQYVLDEIFTPLMQEMGSEGDAIFTQHEDGILSDGDTGEGTSSDYEMEFQLTLKRQAHYLDLKQLNREQRDYRHQQELEKLREERENRRNEAIKMAREEQHIKVEDFWQKMKLSDAPKRRKLQLKQFIFRFASGLGKTHPRLAEARDMLREL